MMSKFGWCLVWGDTPHTDCPRKIQSMGRWYECSCPCHLENDKALEELI